MLAYQHACYGPAPTSCLFLLIHQAMPSGKPNLVTPSLTKLDVEALKRGIPKYHLNMPQPASSTWEQCLGKIDGLTFVPESYEWPVTKLKNARRTELAPPSAHLPPDLLELREKEVQPTQEVSQCTSVHITIPKFITITKV